MTIRKETKKNRYFEIKILGTIDFLVERALRETKGIFFNRKS